jgi:signal transduction histidine kinase
MVGTRNPEETLRSLLALFQRMADCTVEEILTFSLEEGERLTQSRVGYFHFVDPDQRTLILTSWSRATHERCTAPGSGSHYSIDEAGVWVDCVHLRRPVIHNDYASLPNRKGLPAGHVPITRDLAVPIFDKDKIVAVLGVGNKDEDYDDFDVEQLSLLGENTWSIIQRKRAEQQLKAQAEALVHINTALTRSNDALARSNAALDEFAYVTSHDLKEPLRGIHNYAQFLLEDYADRLDDPGREKLLTLTTLSLRMSGLIDALLEYSRVGRTGMNLRKVNLQRLVQEVLESLHVWLVEQDVEVRLPRPLPNEVCDGVWVAEIFRNLITNAAKYNQKSEKWVEIGYEDTSRGRAPRVYYVRDNGIGIAERHLEQVFRIFKRLHGRDAFGGGTGVGLTIARKIVERHGGRIWVDSREGEGSTFHFTLRRTRTQRGSTSAPKVGAERTPGAGRNSGAQGNAGATREPGAVAETEIQEHADATHPVG